MKLFVLYLTLVFSLATVPFAPNAEAQPNLAQERKVGANADKIIREHFGVYKDDKLQKYVSGLGRKLLKSIDDPEFEFHFLVIDDPMLNAFAVPGGYIYITRGMIAYLNSEAALAGVLAHEIGHVVGHHSYKQMQKSFSDTLVILAGLGASIASGSGSAATAWASSSSALSAMSRAGYGRALEEQADEFGMLYAYDAGWDPREQSKFFDMLQFKQRVSGSGYHSFLATHPDTVMRIVKTRGKAEIVANRGDPVKVNREEFLNQIKGLAYGKKNRLSRLAPPYVLDIHTAEEGETFRSLARDMSGDESLAFEMAIMNYMKINDPIPAGTVVKVPVKRKLHPEASIYKDNAKK